MSDFIQALENNTELLSAGGLPGIAPVANPGINSSSAAISIPGSSTSNSSSPVTLSEPVPLTGELDPEPLLEPKSQPLGGLLDPKTAKTSEETADSVAGNPTKNFTNTTQDATGNSGNHAGLLAGPVADTDPLTGERSNPTNPEPQSLLATTAIPSTQSSTGGQDVTGDPLLAPTQTSATQTQTTTATETVKDSSLAIPDNFTSGVFTVGKEGEVGVDFLFDGGAYKGELAIFSLAGMEDLSVNSVDFIREATKRALSGSNLGHVVIADRTEGAKFGGATGSGAADSFNTGDYLGLKTFQMKAGDKFAVMMSPDGSFEKLLNNPNAGGSWRPLFSLAPANPNAVIQTARIADITGDGQAFAMEDLRLDGKSDKDFNDLVFQFRGATGRVSGGVDPDRLPTEVRGYVTDPKFTILTTDPFPGRPVDVEFRVSNPQDGTTGTARMDFYLSTDSVFGDQNDIFLGGYTSESLAPGASTGLVQTSVTMPPNFYPFWNQIGDGQYYIGMVPSTTSTITTDSVVNPAFISRLGETFGSVDFDLAGETPDRERLTYPASLQGRTYRGIIGGDDPADNYFFALGADAYFDFSVNFTSPLNLPNQSARVEILTNDDRLVASGVASPGNPLRFDEATVELTFRPNANTEFYPQEFSESAWIQGAKAYRVRVTSDFAQPTNYELTLKATPTDSRILWTAPDGLFYSSASLTDRATTTDPSWFNALHPANRLNRDVFDAINLSNLRNTNPEINGSGIKIAVLDTGINARSPFLGSRIEAGLNYVANQSGNVLLGMSEDNDDSASGHGSNIAGIIAGRSTPNIFAEFPNFIEPNAHPFLGIAPNAEILDIKVLTPDKRLEEEVGSVGYFPALDNALSHIATRDDVDVVNLSLNVATSLSQSELEEYGNWIRRRIDYLESQGKIVVVSSGNYYGTPGYQDGTAFPANLPNVVAVGATSSRPISLPSDGMIEFFDRSGDIPTYAFTDRPLQVNQTAPFSQRDASHPNLIWAPGVEILGARGEVVTGRNLPMQYLSGTSQAAAVISGVAALAQQTALESLGQKLTPEQFSSLLNETSDPTTDDPRYRVVNVERLLDAVRNYQLPEPEPEPDVTTELIVTIGTGNDDLRGGQDNVGLRIFLLADRGTLGKTYRSVFFPNINESRRWGDRSTNIITKSLPPGFTTEDVAGIELETAMTGTGIFTDNWVLREVSVTARSTSTTGAETTLLINEDPNVRLDDDPNSYTTWMPGISDFSQAIFENLEDGVELTIIS